jgi:hypothetical protein
MLIPRCNSNEQTPGDFMRLAACLAAVCLFGHATEAATPVTPPKATVYNPLETFAPLTLPGPINRYRSASGAPGPDYWQNEADYDIHANLDAVAKTITATMTISYTNNSPDTLDFLWLQLDQNIYRKDSRAALSRGFRGSQSTEGYAIESVAVEQGGHTAPAAHLVSDTRMRVDLSSPLAHGGKLKLHITYHYTIPGLFGTSWVATKNGDIFDIAQWFPRMAVYDDIRGWDTAPYLGQEFYLEYGHIDYAVTVPADMIVAGTGELANPNEVLTSLERSRLVQARSSDKTVMIRSADEVPSSAPEPAGGKTLTWRFRMDKTRDVAFSASRAFIWDAARINLPGGKTALAESVYPVESAGDAGWGRSTEYLKDSVEHFSQRWFVYPYPTAWSVAGGSSGMEYPGMAFDGIGDKGKALFWITAHEIGHTWYPMTVGSDERRDAWMDEGFNTFIDVYESDQFEGGVYGPKRDSEYAQGGGNPVDEIQSVLADPEAPPIVSRADTINEKYRHAVTYFKTALGLVMLREQILGPDRFDPAFRKYTADWAFKHPKPSDFFRTMESEAGEDLSWYWRGWFLENWTLDLAVEDVAYNGGDPAKGAAITIANLDRMVMPSVLEVKYVSGATTRIALPAETWILRGRTKVTVQGGGPIATVTIDPDHVVPDKDRSNNVFAPKS